MILSNIKIILSNLRMHFPSVCKSCLVKQMVDKNSPLDHCPTCQGPIEGFNGLRYFLSKSEEGFGWIMDINLISLSNSGRTGSCKQLWTRWCRNWRLMRNGGGRNFMRKIPRRSIKKRKMVYSTHDEEKIYMMVGRCVEGGENENRSICHNLSSTVAKNWFSVILWFWYDTVSGWV